MNRLCKLIFIHTHKKIFPFLLSIYYKSIIDCDIYSISNYPNPFNPVTSINYSLAKGSNIKIVIYDILGNVVKEVYSGFETPGKKSINWNATNFKGETVSSGIYFYEIESNRYRVVKRMMYLK